MAARPLTKRESSFVRMMVSNIKAMQTGGPGRVWLYRDSDPLWFAIGMFEVPEGWPIAARRIYDKLMQSWCAPPARTLVGPLCR